ncbi:MAG: hypothetical protein AB1762_11135 [Gemmatimonadota bacterium]
MTSRHAFAIALIAALLACGGERSPEPSTLRSGDEAFLIVQNDHWLDATIYAVRAGTRQRLGTAPGLKTDTIPLRLSVVSGAGSVRLIAEPIGQTGRHVSEPINVDRGDVVELRIRDPLNLSSVAVYHP